MKRFVAFIFFVAVVLNLTSCGLFGKEKDIDLNAIWEKIEEETDLPIMQTPTSAKMAEFYPSFVADQYNQFLFKVAAQNIKAEEIILLQVKNKNNLDKAYSMINKRVEDKQAYFKNFLEKPYSMTNNYLLKTYDRYVIFAVSAEVDKIERIFMSMITGEEYSEITS